MYRKMTGYVKATRVVYNDKNQDRDSSILSILDIYTTYVYRLPF